MEPRFDHKNIEGPISELWENSGCFKAVRDPKKKPFTIVLPPPNASGKMHTGNVLMIALEDVLIRWKRMCGYSALWVPGTDHAGFETQTTYERELKKEGKSRFDFDRATLYQNIWDFVHKNKGLIEEQIRKMGASVDWSRNTFMLDDRVLDTVTNTFEKMYKDGLVYRDDYLVNFCPKCGTTFADLEVIYEDRVDSLYYLKYGPIVVATVRPETMFGDVAVAVNPKDKRYKDLIGKEIEVTTPIGKMKLPVVGDSYADPKFGTGAVKITPAHDKNDYEVAKRHNLKAISVIDIEGKMTGPVGKYAGLSAKKARELVVEDLKALGLIEKIDDKYAHSVSLCYKGNHEIEPTILTNWFVKVGPLKKPALDAVLNGDVTIYPKWRKITYTKWMEEMHDWPISRQVVWGIRIPAWYDVTKNDDLLITFLDKDGKVVKGSSAELLKTYSFEDIESGLQTMLAPKNANEVVSKVKPGKTFLQDSSTFDTWFSSGQWPLTTLGYPDSEDFKYFYPTSVLETGWEIIRFWVSRMIMFGIYLTGKPPFKDVYLHGLVRALDGKKMSKSLGNIVNPDEYLETYGTDALRMGLISGTANGKDFAFPKDKVIAYRNFANKLWNMGRFMSMMIEDHQKNGGVVRDFDKTLVKSFSVEDKEILKELKSLIKKVNSSLEKYRFSDAAEHIYQFTWHEVADKYIELVKTRDDKDVALAVLCHVYFDCLKMLHPFMPFVTESLWQQLNPKKETVLAATPWPTL